MATSDSDDFESADEELVAADDITSRKSSNQQRQWRNPTSTIGSDSDDDNECMPANTKNSTTRNSGNCSVQSSGQDRRRSRNNNLTSENPSIPQESSVTDCPEEIQEKTEESRKTSETCLQTRSKNENDDDSLENQSVASRDAKNDEITKKLVPSQRKSETCVPMTINEPLDEKSNKIECLSLKEELDKEATKKISIPQKTPSDTVSQPESKTANKREKPQRQKKPKEATGLGAKKLGSKTNAGSKPPPVEASTPQEIRQRAIAQGEEPPAIEECWEFDEEETAKILKGLSTVDKVKMPEELRSEKKFKEIFKPDGWEGLDDESILSQLDDNRTGGVLTKIVEPENSGWGGWGSWGVTSLINSATAGVSTLTNHVTHGLTLLDEAMGAPPPQDLAKDRAAENCETNEIDDDECCGKEEVQPQVSFGFNDLLSGVSSITKLVETTGSKVISGGLETLETIGKKTMQVLQEGDPGLKKKRAFFLNESDKPILSQMLREAKEKAETEEKSLEEKELSRKVHFESLFDDFQGLVHLEALEMLSKQCNMKIQQRLVILDAEELNSVQETLEEVKELCDLGNEEEEEEDDENECQENLEQRLEAACKDLGLSITYEKLNDIWADTRKYVEEISSEESSITERQVFQRAISTLARFTAFSVERFHKTAELLLIKERRSTVNEADALVQLTRILSRQIAIAANIFSNWLNERVKKNQQPDNKVDITTIFLEAANASSYIQDAFRLLIPILQVGAI